MCSVISLQYLGSNVVDHSTSECKQPLSRLVVYTTSILLAYLSSCFSTTLTMLRALLYQDVTLCECSLVWIFPFTIKGVVVVVVVVVVMVPLTLIIVLVSTHCCKWVSCKCLCFYHVITWLKSKPIIEYIIELMVSKVMLKASSRFNCSYSFRVCILKGKCAAL